MHLRRLGTSVFVGFSEVFAKLVTPKCQHALVVSLGDLNAL
jgi:hypothetical protein